MKNPRNSRTAIGRAALILSFLLMAQAAVFYGFSRGEYAPSHRPLDEFPTQVGSWKMIQQGVMEQEIKDVLRADDYITRSYANGRDQANLFVAFFKSQRAGQAPHSPKNCLPGAGWIWTVSDQIPITLPDDGRTVSVNRYIVQKGDQKSLMLYWYQSRQRVVASEYAAKVFVIADAIRYNRTDTSLVRIEVPILQGNDQAATNTAVEFVKTFFKPLSGFLPS